MRRALARRRREAIDTRRPNRLGLCTDVGPIPLPISSLGKAIAIWMTSGLGAGCRLSNGIHRLSYAALNARSKAGSTPAAESDT